MVGLFFIVLIGFVFFWICINYLKLEIANNKTKKKFSILDKFAQEKLFPLAASDDAKKYITWYLSTDNTDRKIALCKAIKDLVNNEEINAKMDEPIKIYNKHASILKHYTDVFPTSFIARLREIKSIDLFD